MGDGNKMKPGIKTWANLAKDLLYFSVCSIIILIRNLVQIFLPADPKKLTDEIILVTGGANGIGREICCQLVLQEQNLTIITWDVNQEENEETVKVLQKLGVKAAYAFTVDISEKEQVENGARKIRDEIGDVTIVFNNAGIAGCTNDLPGWKQNPNLVEKVMKVNMLSHCWILQEFLPKMIERGEGNVVETCSVLGWAYGPIGSAYVGSKFALRGYIECIKEDLRRFCPKANINISLVYPHHVQTNMTANVDFLMSKYEHLVELNMSPAYVASKIVSGMRNYEEHIFVPKSAFLIKFVSLLPPDIFRKFIDIFADKYEPAVEQNGNKGETQIQG